LEYFLSGVIAAAGPSSGDPRAANSLTDACRGQSARPADRVLPRRPAWRVDCAGGQAEASAPAGRRTAPATTTPEAAARTRTMVRAIRMNAAVPASAPV